MLFRLLVVLATAALVGSVGSMLAGRRSAPGCLGSIALGFIGALLGDWLSRFLEVRDLITVAGIPVIWSVVGASLFVALLEGLSSNRR